MHYGVDGSEERISLHSASIFYVTVDWNILTKRLRHDLDF